MPVKIDVIIISYAKTNHLQNITLQGINTLLASENPNEIIFNILVLESNKTLTPYQYPNTKTLYPDAKFGYHKYLNIGINATDNDYVCLCNNDLIYHKGWASEIIKAMRNDPKLLSATPYCPIFHKAEGFGKNMPPLEGYFGLLIGWCIFVKREIFDIIGQLDEKLTFWYCDYDYTNTLQKYQIKNCLISNAVVTHIGSESLKTLNNSDYQNLTQLPRAYFNYKWNHHSYLKYMAQLAQIKAKNLLNI